MPGVGQQFDFDRFPQAMRGGMRVYPYGGILSGLQVGALDLTTGVLSIPYSAGVVRLDGQQFSIAADNDGSGYQKTGLQANTSYTYDLYVKPTYANAVVTAAVAPGAAAPVAPAGNYKLHCVDMGDYYQLVDWYKYDSAWAKHDPIFDKPSLDYGNLPHNEIVGAVVGFEPDKMVYNKVASAPFLSMPAPHYVRYDVSFKFATLTVEVGGTTSTIADSAVEYEEIYIPM